MTPTDGFDIKQAMTVKEFYEEEEQPIVLPGDTNKIGPRGPRGQ